MGEKEMIDSKDDTEQLEAVEVTLDGYQFTEFEPNEEEAPRFEDFDDGIVLLTAKFHIDNKGDAEMSRSAMESKLTMSDGAQYMLGEGMLLDYRNDDNIETGDPGNILQVFTMDKEQYDKI